MNGVDLPEFVQSINVPFYRRIVDNGGEPGSRAAAEVESDRYVISICEREIEMLLRFQTCRAKNHIKQVSKMGKGM